MVYIFWITVDIVVIITIVCLQSFYNCGAIAPASYWINARNIFQILFYNI